MGVCIRALPLALLAFLAQTVWGAEALPPGFVRLHEVAPSIRQDIRYAGRFNFTGQVVPGYERAECILRDRVAKALAGAQTRLSAEGFALKVYDCYRPVRAVRAFAAWSRSPGGDAMRSVFYPALDKSSLFALGYIAPHSRHSLGTAVDVGLVRADESDGSAASTGGRCDGPFEQRAGEVRPRFRHRLRLLFGAQCDRKPEDIRGRKGQSRKAASRACGRGFPQLLARVVALRAQ